MKIHFVGFEWTPTNAVPLAELFGILDGLNAQPVTFEHQTRILFTGRSGDFYCGLLLSVKDETRYNLLNQADLTVEVKDLAPNQRFFDFSGFVVNTATGKGVYAAYFRSMTVQQFFRFCAGPFEARKKAKRKADEQSGALTPAQLNSRYEDFFEAAVIVRAGKLEQLLDTLSKVNSFEFRVTTEEEAQEPWFGLVSGVAKNVTRIISFEPHAERDDRVRAIRRVLRQCDVTKAAVRGKNMEGFDDVLHLAENPDSFGIWDLPDGPTKKTVQTDNVAGSDLVVKLLTIARENPGHFGSRS